MYGKPIGNHTVFACYTSETTIALWHPSSRQLWQVVRCIFYSLSKVEELFYSFQNRNRTVSLEFQDKKISQVCKVCFECLSVVSMCLFIFSFLLNLAASFFERHGFLTDWIAARAASPTVFSSLPLLFVFYSICPNTTPPQTLL